MTYKQNRITETVEVRVRVSPEAAAILRRETERPGATTMAATAGRILTDAVMMMDKVRREKEAEERFGAVDKRTVLTLSENYTASQISAILRIPYKQVMTELGKQVDKAVIGRQP